MLLSSSPASSLLTHMKQTWQATSERPKGYHNVTFLDFGGRVCGDLLRGYSQLPASRSLFILFVEWQLECLHLVVKRMVADKCHDHGIARYNLHSWALGLSWRWGQDSDTQQKWKGIIRVHSVSQYGVILGILSVLHSNIIWWLWKKVLGNIIYI